MNNNLTLLQGNEAIALGAIKAGVTFYGGYPITPSSEVMHTFAKKAAKNKDLTFIQFEDEIASICSVVGASLGGAKAMTATSGPGFSLMQEGLGLAHMIPTPLLLVDVQRVGPSTGMPTLPAQGDVLQAYHGGHGDYSAIAFAPSSVEECYYFTIQAVNLSQQTNLPVILLSDAFLGHLYETVNIKKYEDTEIITNDQPIFAGKKRHATGLLNDQGVPKTKDGKFYRQWLTQRKQTVAEAVKDYAFDQYLENKNSKKLIITYGSMARLIMPFRDEFAIYRPIRLFPILEDRLKEVAADYDQIAVAEMNDGQYAGLVEQVLHRPVERINLLGGELNLNQLQAQWST
ncbi:MAG: 2-oxoacid:acceptor oxidoreductase subunit alpha [Candidatus Pacebacteria bacterium]|nr:2-oxoacid:acceptor oxidoreductase subunit alpha [Candidatus Paceibacterota bacterium]